MKILITGSTSSQSSSKTFSRTPTFAGLLANNLSSPKVEVEFSIPYLEWDDSYLKKFDAILVGISPLTSLSANSLYPALLVAARAEKMKKLSLFIDAPEPQKIAASLSSFSRGKVDLFKPFYENRRGYDKIVEDPGLMRRVEVFCTRLIQADWPETLYPWMPWIPPSQVERHLPKASGLHGIPIDSYLMKKPYIERSLSRSESDYWVYDNNKSKWFRTAERSINYPTVPVKENRFSDAHSASQRVSGAIGSLISTYRSDEAWWTPLLATSLNLGVPAVSDWRVTNILGEDWNHLPASVEDMTNAERFKLALGQRASYMDMLDSKKETDAAVLSVLTK